jgi:hypothetical protein
MRPIQDYPEFSNIRSHIERVEAQRHFRAGIALAGFLIAAGRMLQRGISAAVGVAAWSARGPRNDSMLKRFTPHR